MSRLWDTPEFWARSEADEMLRDYPNTDVRALADSFARTSSSYDGDPEFAREIVVELRKRAHAGVRFWPQPANLASIEDEVRSVLVPELAGQDGEAPSQWWQRM